MKKLLLAIMLLAVPACAEDGRMFYVAMTDGLFQNGVVYTNVGSAMCDIDGVTASAENIDLWMNSGQTNRWMSSANTNLIIHVWIWSVRQSKAELRNTLTGPEKTRYKNWIKDRAGIQADVKRKSDRKTLFASWGLVERPN